MVDKKTITKREIREYLLNNAPNPPISYEVVSDPLGKIPIDCPSYGAWEDAYSECFPGPILCVKERLLNHVKGCVACAERDSEIQEMVKRANSSKCSDKRCRRCYKKS